MPTGAVTTTLDFGFFGGGYTQVSGVWSGSIDATFTSTAFAPVNGILSPVTLEFALVAGIETPTVYGRAADLSFDFAASSTVEFGVQRFGAVGTEKVVLFEYTAESTGYNLTHANFNPTLDFTLDTEIYLFSSGGSVGSYGFNITSTGLNISTRSYSRDGATYCEFNAVDFNDAHIKLQSNSMEITNNGINYAEIIQK
jgi:hypothetical protein